MNSLRFQSLVYALVLAAVSLQVYAASWRSVQDQSQLEFIANYEGAETPGRFKRFDVLVSFDPASKAVKSLLVDVEIASASMGSAEIDEAIVQPEWFNAQAFPHASFRSEQVRVTNDSEYVAEGVVSIKGVSRSISVPFHWRWHEQEAKLTGSLALSRVDFGIGSGQWESDSPIGQEVRVRFGVALKAEK